MNSRRFAVGSLLCCLIILGSVLGAGAQESSGELTATLLASGLDGSSGSTIGPDGALYVAETGTGSIVRVDPETGEVTPYATGLPPRVIEIGGIMDIAFLDDTAYALVTLVGVDVGSDGISGVYRMDGEDEFSVLADLGQFSIDNPPSTDFFVTQGVQYAMEPFQDGFLVTDGHHNRVLEVSSDGEITEIITFDNIVPTGLELSAEGDLIYMTEAGPVPHLAENGKVMSFEYGSSDAAEVASGARLLVDVEYGCCGTLYALAQGDFEEGNPEGSPAQPNTGSLVTVNEDGTLTVLVGGLNQPTSFEIIGESAYVVTLGGEVWRIDGLTE